MLARNALFEGVRKGLVPIAIACGLLVLLMLVFPQVARGQEVEITKSAKPDPVAAGGVITYTITVTNNYTDSITGVLVTDVVPADTSFVTATLPHTGPVPGPDAGGVITWSLDTLSVGVSRTVTMVVQVDTPLLTDTIITNAAWVTSKEEFTGTDDVTVTVESWHRLDITKTAPITVEAGDLLTYTLAWAVTGNEPASGVTVSDTTPANTTFWTALPPAASDPGLGGAGAVVWPLGDQDPPASGVVTMVVLVDTPLVSGTEIYNVVSISDTQNITGTDDVTVTVESWHRLDITKTAPITVEAGDLLTYTLAWAVTGNEPASHVTVSDMTPANTTFWTALPPAASDPGLGGTGAVVWSLGDRDPPASGVVTMVVLVDTPLVSGTEIYNVVTITDTSGLWSSATQTTTVRSDHTLIVTKTKTTVSPVEPGDTIVYNINYEVSGNEPAPNVAITDRVPTEVSYVICWGASCSESGGVVTWTLGDKEPSDSGQVGLQVTAKSSLLNGTQICNKAHISDDNGEHGLSNQVCHAVQSDHTLAISKRGEPDTVELDGLITYTIDYAITGNEPATKAIITDAVPLGTTFFAATGGLTKTHPAKGGAGVVVWELGTPSPTTDDPETGMVTLVVRANTSLDDGDIITNVAFISDKSEKHDLSEAVVTTVHAPIRICLPLVLKAYTPPGPNLSTSTKTADKAAVNAGEVLAYTIVLRNSGDVQANVNLADPIPAQTTFVAGSEQDCTYNSVENQVEWNGPLGSGGSHTCQFSIQTKAEASGSIVNEAKASYGSRSMPVETSTPVMVTNGGFETGDTTGWQVEGDAVLPAPGVVTADPYGGSHHLLLGDSSYCNTSNPGQAGDHASTATQSIFVPDVAGTPTLKFWYRVFTYDHLTWTDGKLGDSLDVYVESELALQDNYENYPGPSPKCDNLQDSGWRTPDNPWGGQVHPQVLDLSEWKGQQVKVRFELWTRWDGYYNTWAYIDDVQVEIAP